MLFLLVSFVLLEVVVGTFIFGIGFSGITGLLSRFFIIHPSKIITITNRKPSIPKIMRSTSLMRSLLFLISDVKLDCKPVISLFTADSCFEKSDVLLVFKPLIFLSSFFTSQAFLFSMQKPLSRKFILFISKYLMIVVCLSH